MEEVIELCVKTGEVVDVREAVEEYDAVFVEVTVRVEVVESVCCCV